MSLPKFWGKYRGTVVNNIDPEQRGRIQAIVPAVTGLVPSSWAMPCVPFAGKQEGFFAVPQIASGVWIEYEDGNPDKPIWVGGIGVSPRRSPRGACAAADSAWAERRGSNHPAERDHRQRLGAHSGIGGNHAQEHHGGDDCRQRQRNLHLEREGRADHDDRSGGHGESGRAGGDVSGGVKCRDS